MAGVEKWATDQKYFAPKYSSPFNFVPGSPKPSTSAPTHPSPRPRRRERSSSAGTRPSGYDRHEDRPRRLSRSETQQPSSSSRTRHRSSSQVPGTGRQPLAPTVARGMISDNPHRFYNPNEPLTVPFPRQNGTIHAIITEPGAVLHVPGSRHPSRSPMVFVTDSQGTRRVATSRTDTRVPLKERAVVDLHSSPSPRPRHRHEKECRPPEKSENFLKRLAKGMIPNVEWDKHPRDEGSSKRDRRGRAKRSASR